MPLLLILIEYMKGFVAELGELRAPAGAAFHGAVLQNLTYHKHFLGVVDLVPDALQNFFQERPLGVGPVHQFGNVGQADVAMQ